MITRPAADATKLTAAAGNFLRKFHKWHQKRLIGVSLKVVAPTGQYNETKLINWDANGWAFRPEARILRALGQGRAGRLRRREVLSLNPNYFGHNNFVPGSQDQSQTPVGTFEGHLSYDWKLRTWVSLDGG